MKELAVISGKGGTGKTSIVSSFAVLAGRSVLADCDVDAANLHLILQPEIRKRHPFSGGKAARIDPTECVNCGKCQELCRFNAVLPPSEGQDKYRIDSISCEGCGVCAWFCPAEAIRLEKVVNGELFISNSGFGPMIHARLGIAEENSGKLVSQVRQIARKTASEKNINRIIIDGSPGIGCTVISSISGVHTVLAVSEPTLSGLHDLERVIELTQKFSMKVLIAINKWNINKEICSRIETYAEENDITVAGKVRYDKNITLAQVERKSVVEFTETGAGEDIRRLWEIVEREMEATN